jgi:hypothetical protein
MARSTSSSSRAKANGFIHQCNVGKKIMKKVAKSCPVIIGTGKSGHNRNIRKFVANNAELTSDAVFGELRKHLESKLKRLGITASTELSNGEWVLALPNNRGNTGGVKHRDVNFKQPGYLTVLLFFGDRKSKGYGSAKIWRNTQTFMKNHTFIDKDKGEFKNHMRELQKFDELEEGGGRGLILSPDLFNCAIFDSRLWHQSLPHTSHAHRVSLTFFLKLKEGKLQPTPPADTTYSYYLKRNEWEAVDLSKYI